MSSDLQFKTSSIHSGGNSAFEVRALNTEGREVAFMLMRGPGRLRLGLMFAAGPALFDALWGLASDSEEWMAMCEALAARVGQSEAHRRLDAVGKALAQARGEERAIHPILWPPGWKEVEND